MSSILITHDLGLAADYCDRLAVMKDGQIVETGNASDLFADPQHPYTRKLVDATPRPGAQLRDLLPVETRTPLADHIPGERRLLEVVDLVKTYPFKSGPVHAVKGISFDIREGQSVGLVGESGCGKSTTSSMLVRLLDVTSGSILFDGFDIAGIPAEQFVRDARRSQIQMVFRDATDSLNPRLAARQSIADPILRMSDLREGCEADRPDRGTGGALRVAALPARSEIPDP